MPAKNPANTGVKVSEEGKAFLEELSAWSGQTQKVALTRLLEWGAELSRTPEGQDVIGAIIGALPTSRRSTFARTILEQLANDGRQAPRLAAKQSPPRAGKRPPNP